jgi:hypothetical protein
MDNTVHVVIVRFILSRVCSYVLVQVTNNRPGGSYPKSRCATLWQYLLCNVGKLCPSSIEISLLYVCFIGKRTLWDKMLSCMEGFECSVLLEGVSYQFVQDIKKKVCKCNAFLALNTLRRPYWSRQGGHRQHSIRAAQRSLVARGIVGMGVLDILAGRRTKQRALVDDREEDQQPSKCNIVNNQPEMLMWQWLPLWVKNRHLMMKRFSQRIVSAKAAPTSNQGGKRDGTWDHFQQETEAPLLIANRRDHKQEGPWEKGHRFPYDLSGTKFMRSIKGLIEAIHGKPVSWIPGVV